MSLANEIPIAVALSPMDGTTTLVADCPYCRKRHHFFRPVDVPIGFRLAVGESCSWGAYVPHCEVGTARRTMLLVETGRPRGHKSAARSMTLVQRSRIMERDGFHCRRCGHGPEDGVKLVVDHIVPVSRGGTSIDSNLQTLCRDCNAGKGARDPHPHDFIE